MEMEKPRKYKILLVRTQTSFNKLFQVKRNITLQIALNKSKLLFSNVASYLINHTSILW